MDIGEVAERAGVAASTLRYYESIGLIESAGRVGLRRQFHPQVIDRLALIALGRSAGFSLDEIGGMLRRGVGLALDRRVLRAKADELDRHIRRLVAMREGLRHAAACPAPSHMECPTFRRLMSRALGHGVVEPKAGLPATLAAARAHPGTARRPHRSARSPKQSNRPM